MILPVFFTQQSFQFIPSNGSCHVMAKGSANDRLLNDRKMLPCRLQCDANATGKGIPVQKKEGRKAMTFPAQICRL